ncbi:DNA polymerase III subunit delta [Paracrocinitomix mangrovi]|uniref:DNA polymerase III subunit delta n=1 Tax=Paracrocinitomix mangrovi TaxID=2862509 RepID=UPI001C8DCBD0|nr:DNA polymerase III subunit delta [Paracrocinitomix mangrovi]UKN01297.1 DNA polymerase III subunit delta [Paracrocinitomix mangrovi]
MTYKDILKDFKERKFKPIYFLHGEESFYIDVIVKAAMNEILDESERDFNQTVLYAKDTQPIDVVDAASRLPMMSEYQVVVLKEAQEYKRAAQWEAFEQYFESPSHQTILVIAHKYKKFDKRSRIYKILAKKAVIFESEGIKDYQLPGWISEFVRSKGWNITDKACALVAEYIGNELERIVNELEKLFIVVEEGKQINEKHVEKHIGISKDYNVFELTNAILEKDIVKAYRIVKYFGENPKATHITVVLGSLYSLYQRLFKAHFAKTDDPGKLASILKIHPYPAKELIMNKRKHPAKIISRNFTILREYDLMAKGVNNGGATDAELMKELVYKLLH